LNAAKEKDVQKNIQPQQPILDKEEEKRPYVN
jgi:hypothetical protein